MDLNQRVANASAKAIEEAKAECKKRGSHKWDSPGGRLVSGGGEPITGYTGGPDIPEVEYDDRWSHYQRKCVDCGHVETSDVEGYEWKYDDGKGEFGCDKRTGRLYWWDKIKNVSQWVDHLK